MRATAEAGFGSSGLQRWQARKPAAFAWAGDEKNRPASSLPAHSAAPDSPVPSTAASPARQRTPPPSSCRRDTAPPASDSRRSPRRSSLRSRRCRRSAAASRARRRQGSPRPSQSRCRELLELLADLALFRRSAAITMPPSTPATAPAPARRRSRMVSSLSSRLPRAGALRRLRRASKRSANSRVAVSVCASCAVISYSAIMRAARLGQLRHGLQESLLPLRTDDSGGRSGSGK
jgi:hypothetical protein